MVPHNRAELLARIDGRRVIASVSGGKDSAAMCLYLQELDIPHERVFFDTNWEHPRLYEYLRGELTKALGPIHELRSSKYPGGMPELVRKRGMFSSRTRRFCTQELKIFPMVKYLEDLAEDAVNTVGIRAAESEARSKYPEWEDFEGTDCEVWRPLLRWSEQDVIDIHHRHGLRPNPLYLGIPRPDGSLGPPASRVGCWPCLFARKAEIATLAECDPGRIDTIRELERDVQETAAARYAAKGETFESKAFNRPTFFQAMGALRTEAAPCACAAGVCRFCKGSGKAPVEDDEETPGECAHCHGSGKCDGTVPWVREGRMIPIDDVVTWARTGSGGRQFELFAPAHEAGCVRWGMCDAGRGPRGGDGC